MNELTVLIVDDNVVLRKGLKEYLSADLAIRIVGEARDGWEAIEQTKKLAPQVVLMDVSMPGLNGLEATSQIKQDLPQTYVIILSRFDQKVYREAALAQGADEYVAKHNLTDELLPLIQSRFPRATQEQNA